MTEEESQRFRDTKMKELQKQLENEEISEEVYEKALYQYPKTKIVDVRVFNETIWEKSKLEQPVIFVCQKNQEEKSAVKLIDQLKDMHEIRKQIKYLSEPAYYTDVDNVNAISHFLKFECEWLILFYKKTVGENHPIIPYFKKWARDNIFKFKRLKFAVLDGSSITLLELEKGIPDADFPMLYYFKFPTKNKDKLLKHKLKKVDTPALIQKAVGWIERGEWDPYFFEESIDKSIHSEESRERLSPRFERLVRSTFSNAIKDRTGHVLVLARKQGSLKPFSDIIEKFFKEVENRNSEMDIKFYHIDVEKNEVGIEVNRGFKFLLYDRDHDTVRTSYNLDSLKSLVNFISDSIDEAKRIFKSEESIGQAKDEEL